MQRRDVLKGLSLLLGGGLSSACQQALNVPVGQRSIGQAGYTQQQRAIAHRVADLIIPATDTPGALEAGAGEFIDYTVAVWFEDDERQRFITGLDDLEQAALERFNVSFIALDEAQQIQLLEKIEQQAAPVDMFQPVGAGDFFAQIKELTVAGYYTSQAGATRELKYLPMPGYYDGHYKFAQTGRQWSS